MKVRLTNDESCITLIFGDTNLTTQQSFLLDSIPFEPLKAISNFAVINHPKQLRSQILA